MLMASDILSQYGLRYNNEIITSFNSSSVLHANNEVYEKTMETTNKLCSILVSTLVL